MIDKWLINIVVGFILRQIAKAGAAIDWAALKAQTDAAVRAVVPGDWFDDEAVAVVNEVLDACQAVLADKDDLEDLLRKLAASDWTGAVAALKALLLTVWHPGSTDAGKRALAALAA